MAKKNKGTLGKTGDSLKQAVASIIHPPERIVSDGSSTFRYRTARTVIKKVRLTRAQLQWAKNNNVNISILCRGLMQQHMKIMATQSSK